MIPKIFHRVVPDKIPAYAEEYWARLKELHPGWEFRTWYDLDLSEDLQGRCLVNVQKADLLRYSVVWAFGGIYLDSDVEPIRSFEPLLQCQGFAAWESREWVCNAVIGAEPFHPVLQECWDTACERVGTVPHSLGWQTGPGMITEVVRNRSDFLLLPPGTFYPYFWGEVPLTVEYCANDPWCFGIHRWAQS